MTSSIEHRLDQIRGAAKPRSHDARTIAALTGNPGCARRAIMDAAGIDKARLASYVDFPASYGQSRFAITRGNAFEAQVKADGGAELLRLLRERLGLPIPEVSYDDLQDVGGNDGREVRHARFRAMLDRVASGAGEAGALLDHPMLRLSIGGRWVYLEPDLIAFQYRDLFHVVEIKSFAVIDGQADGAKVAAAAVQSAVYVLTLRRLMAELGHDPERISHDVVLVCPENFSNRPVATRVDVRKQLIVLERQLARLARIESIVDALPADLTFDLGAGDDDAPARPVAEVVDALRRVEARYAPECLSTCELSYFCRHEARGGTASLGRTVREELGGVESVDTVLGLAAGTLGPAEDQVEAAAALRTAARLRAECLGGTG